MATKTVETKRVDLHLYARGTTILAGRDRGKELRDREKLDDADRKPDVHIETIIPDYLLSMNSSFFLGAFEDSVRVLGEKGFREKYTFIGPRAEETKEDGIRTALLMGRRFRPRRPADRVA